jgi:hypothetical protein
MKALLLGLAILLMGAAGTAAGAVDVVGWAEFLVARPVSSSHAPGLVSLSTSSSQTGTQSNAVPSIPACLARWNAAAPAATKKWIASRAHAADVTRLQTAQQAPGATSTFVISQCAYGIAVGKEQILLVAAPVAGTSDPWRGSVMRYRSVRTVTQFRKRFNAVVRPNGSLKFGH